MSCRCKMCDKPTQEDINERCSKYDWNVTLGSEHIPMQVYKIEGCIHTKGGKWGINDLYVAKRDIPKEKLTPSDLTPFNGDICWSYSVENKNHYGKDDIRNSTKAKIFCGGEQVYELVYSWNFITHKIMTIINELQEHPIPFNLINYEKEILGRKIWWRDQPAVIIGYSKPGGTVNIAPDGKAFFELLNRDKNEECEMFTDYATEPYILEDILAPSINWFRD